MYSFNNGDGEYGQLIMKAPQKLKCDVSNKFPYKFLEKKKQNKNTFESNYETKSQTARAGKKHTITTDSNKVIHQKLLSNLLPNSFQNPLSRRGKQERTRRKICPKGTATNRRRHRRRRTRRYRKNRGTRPKHTKQVNRHP